jgi:hypothetical protein
MAAGEFALWLCWSAANDPIIARLHERAMAESEAAWAADHVSLVEPQADGTCRLLWFRKPSPEDS